MWRDDHQRGRVARALLGLVGLGRLWTPAGPTDEAVRLLESGGGPLSGGQALVLRAAFDAWNGEGRAPLGELLGRLDNEKLAAVGRLLVAVAAGDDGAAVDAWLSRYGPGVKR